MIGPCFQMSSRIQGLPGLAATRDSASLRIVMNPFFPSANWGGW